MFLNYTIPLENSYSEYQIVRINRNNDLKHETVFLRFLVFDFGSFDFCNVEIVNFAGVSHKMFIVTSNDYCQLLLLGFPLGVCTYRHIQVSE